MADAKCPHCKAIITFVDFDANYSEYGNCNGTVGFDGDDEETNDNNTNGYETEGHEYRCPECNQDMTWKQMENLEAIQNDDVLPNKLEEGFEYYRKEEEEEEPEKEVEAVNDDGISIAPFCSILNKEIEVYKCSKCKTEIPIERVGTVRLEETCKCGRQLNKDNSIIIKY